jgi:hypothetical protein
MAGAITTVLGTPLFAYSASFFGHTLAAAFLLGAFASKRPIVVGACLALAVGCEYIALVPAAILTAYFTWRTPAAARVKQVALLASGALGPLALLALYHHVCFGAFWRTGYGFVTLPVFAEGHARGVLGVGLPQLDAFFGITLGRARGLFYLAPITLLGIVALAIAWKRSREPELGVCLAVVMALFLANAGYYAWDGGLALGPRHVVPILGFLGIGIGLAFTWARGRWLVIALAIASAMAMVLGVAVGLEIPRTGDALFDHIYPSFLAGHVARSRGASNFGLLLHLGRTASVIPVLLWVAVGAWWLLRPSQFCDASRSRAT